ncbi:lantibiotic dehydratase [Actinoplanes sp. TBRC 11911]|uniref:lantibiotic dehydratase n=1 Tax=Actinoplanes sp. TBRC 11911 TaxID=2729386 RepID=UPI00145ED995|nr:lantibiotic dehydratase [Actinoplanes sp. TBRC 11911]NMO51810.1 lantibiotic dehydratase [Actinoplanes sp. TBRC 11911]
MGQTVPALLRRRAALYEPLGLAMLRTPMLPARPAMRAAEEDPLVRAAIAVASADLAESLRREPSSDRDERRRRHALLRYLNRMSTRPTPYGLFAGVGLVEWGAGTDVAVAASAPRTRTRPDMGWLLDLVGTLERDPAVRPALRVRTHPAVVRRGGRMVAMGADPPVSVRATSVVTQALDLARDPLPVATLAESLRASTGAAADTVDGLIDQLLREGYLLSDLRPPLTGNPAAYVRARLASATPVAAAIDRFLAGCAALDEQPVGTEALAGLTAHARLVPGSRAGGPYAQIDSAVELANARLPGLVATEAARAAELLLRLSPHPHGPARLAGYRREFEARYGRERMVPLLELLDPDDGLGLPPETAPEHAPDDRDALLCRLAVEAARDHDNVLHLDDQLVARLATWTPGDSPAPSSLDISVLIAAASEQAVDSGDFLAVVGPNLGATTGGQNLGRFADLLGAPAYAALSELAGHAAAAAHPAILAEVTYRPLRPRSANVMVRPVVHAHEIPFDVHPSVAPGDQVALDDIRVGLESGRLQLYRASRGVPLIAVQGHMLNGHRAPPIARFLLDVAADGLCQFQPFDWGAANLLPALPRVQAGRIVLAPARWRLDGPVCEAVAGGDSGALRRWRKRWAVPSEVYFGPADQRLLLDLDDHVDVELLGDELRRRPTLPRLQEAIPARTDAWVPGPHGRHLVELTVPLRSTSPVVPRRVRASSGCAPGTRLRLPGSDWLYLKLYGPTTSDDDLIAGPLRAFGEFATAAELCDGWFFLRYADPDPHLRIRFRGTPSTLLGPLLEQVCGWAAELVSTGDRSRFGFDTYEREVERYGAIDAAEDVFIADSPATAALIDLDRGRSLPYDRIAIAVLSADDLLASLGLAAAERLSVYRSMASRSRDGGAQYRRRQRELRRLLQPSARPASVDLVLDGRRRAIQRHAPNLTSQPAPSFVHLHLNRLLGTDRAAENLVVELLRRTRESLSRIPSEER